MADVLKNADEQTDEQINRQTDRVKTTFIIYLVVKSWNFPVW